MTKSANRVSEEFEEARTRKTSYEADLKQMELKKAAGELIEINEIKDAWTDVLANLRSKLLAIPVKLAPIVQNETNVRSIEKVIETHLHEAMNELSEYDPNTNSTKTKDKGISAKRNGGTQATSKTKRKPVGRPRKAAQLRG